MSERFFVESPIVDRHAVLCGQEAHHLVHVMRAKRGETVVVFDGSGAEFAARIAEARKDHVQLEVLSRIETNRELASRLVLAAPPPKGDRFRWLVEKAVELGVARFIPLLTQRSVVEPRPARYERLRRTVVEASKQCGRNRLMEIAAPTDWPALVSDTPKEVVRWVGHAEGVLLTEAWSTTTGAGWHHRWASEGVVVAVGPEGGLTPVELEAACAAGWQPVRLGSTTLRTETAALALCSAAVVWLQGRRRMT